MLREYSPALAKALEGGAMRCPEQHVNGSLLCSFLTLVTLLLRYLCYSRECCEALLRRARTGVACIPLSPGEASKVPLAGQQLST